MTTKSVFTCDNIPGPQVLKLYDLVDAGFLKANKTEGTFFKSGTYDLVLDYSFDYIGTTFTPTKVVIDHIEDLILEYIDMNRNNTLFQLKTFLRNLLTIKYNTIADKIRALEELRDQKWEKIKSYHELHTHFDIEAHWMYEIRKTVNDNAMKFINVLFFHSESIEHDEVDAYFLSISEIEVVINAFQTLKLISEINCINEKLIEITNTTGYIDKGFTQINQQPLGQNSKNKIKWLGSPAQFGYILHLLIEGGYIEKPTSSFEKDASFYLEHFIVDGVKSSIVKELSANTNSVTSMNRSQFKIPNKDKLN